MILNSGTGITVQPGISFAVNAVDRIDRATAFLDPLCLMIHHVEIFKVNKATSLAGNKHDRLACMPVDLKLHIPAQMAAVVLKIPNFHIIFLLPLTYLTIPDSP